MIAFTDLTVPHDLRIARAVHELQEHLAGSRPPTRELYGELALRYGVEVAELEEAWVRAVLS